MDLQAFSARMRALGANFTTGQLVSLFVAFVLVVAVVAGSALWLNAPRYSLLFADMDEEAAGQVVARLKSLKVPYTLDEGGRAIRVQSSRVDELRLELTAQGLPSSGRVGFEIFDRTAFGATEFLEQVNYRRALEGEIARTIATISEVSAARVHIAMGKDSLFGEKRPAKASVVLKLRDQSGLSAGTVTGIANLVAASVEGLRPEAVVILDSGGRPLSRPAEEDGGAMGAGQFERRARLETEMAGRVIALLEPVVGEGRARVNVALTLNAKSREVTEDRWDPNTAVRSRQTSADTATLGLAAGGVAGARANLPVSASAQAAAANAAAAGAPPGTPGLGQAVAAPVPPGSSRNTETTNYEVSRTTSRTIEPPGDVARVSVAVILDDNHEMKANPEGQQTITRVPRTPEELQKLQALVAAAVGTDTTRGDVVTVQNVSFDEPLSEEPVAPSFWSRYRNDILEGLRTVAVLVLGLAAVFFVIRPMVQRGGTAARISGVAASGGTLDRPRTVAELESELEGSKSVAAPSEARRLPALTRQVAGIAQKEPENTARLLRNLMAEQER